MSTPQRPAVPRRFLRTLPWLGGLLLGTAAHLVWWTSMREPERVTHVHVTVPSPELHVRVHRAEGDGVVHVRRADVRAKAKAKARSCRRDARKAQRRTRVGAHGAIVCTSHGCTIRRSFVERMLHDPSLLGPATRVQGMQSPSGLAGLRVLGVDRGSVPDLLGLQRGDVIRVIEG